MKANSSFLPLYVTNFFGTLNDNFLKTLASFTVIGWLADERVKSLAMGVTAGALVLPYILCSPLADRLTAVLEMPSRDAISPSLYPQSSFISIAER